MNLKTLNKHWFKNPPVALAGVDQWVERQPANGKVPI